MVYLIKLMVLSFLLVGFAQAEPTKGETTDFVLSLQCNLINNSKYRIRTSGDEWKTPQEMFTNGYYEPEILKYGTGYEDSKGWFYRITPIINPCGEHKVAAVTNWSNAFYKDELTFPNRKLNEELSILSYKSLNTVSYYTISNEDYLIIEFGDFFYRFDDVIEVIVYCKEICFTGHQPINPFRISAIEAGTKTVLPDNLELKENQLEEDALKKYIDKRKDYIYSSKELRLLFLKSDIPKVRKALDHILELNGSVSSYFN